MDIPGLCALSIAPSQKTPFLNPDPLIYCCGPENVAQVRIDDENSWVLLDNGSMINAVPPEFVEACSLDISPLSNLVNGTVRVNGFGGLFSWPLGYIVIRLEVEGVQGCDKDQVALVTPDPADFGSQLPVTFSTLTINWIRNLIKESKVDELSISLSVSRISHLLACH